MWTEVEAPLLAPRTDSRAIIYNSDDERRINRAASEYRTMFYRAHNALEGIRKRENAEKRDAAKNADREVSRRSTRGTGPAARAAGSAPAPAAAAAGTPAPAAPYESVAPACAAGAGTRDEPSNGVAVPAVAEASVPGKEDGAETRDEPSNGVAVPAGAEASGLREEDGPETRDEPSNGVAVPAGAEASGPRAEEGPETRDEPSNGADTPAVGQRSPDLNHLARFREGEAPSEPFRWARTEPRPPRIRQSHLDTPVKERPPSVSGPEDFAFEAEGDDADLVADLERYSPEFERSRKLQRLLTATYGEPKGVASTPRRAGGRVRAPPCQASRASAAGRSRSAGGPAVSTRGDATLRPARRASGITRRLPGPGPGWIAGE